MPKPRDLNDLRRERRAAAERMQDRADALAALEGADTPDTEAIAAAETAFAEAQAGFETLNAQVGRAEAAEAARAAAATGGDDPAPGTGGAAPTGTARPQQAATPRDPAHRGVEVGFMLHALAASRGDRERAVARLETDGHSGIAAIMSGASEAAGGITIPAAQSEELIALLTPRVTVRASGARTVPMPAGALRTARQSAGATAGYGAETSAIAESEMSFDAVDKSFKLLRALVPLSNSLLRHSSVAMAQHARDDLLKAMALREDLAFLRGDGSNDTPKGLRSWALAANWRDGIAGTAAAAEAAVRWAVSTVEDANVGMVRPGWIMRASAKNWLASLRDDRGTPVFPSIEASGTLKGYPIRTTSQVPDNLGAGGDGTEITFADFDEVVIGDAMQIAIAASTEAAFVDANGETISAFQRDLTLMRAVSEHDLAPSHDEAIAGFTATGWSL
ncbi:phage major capsid protein [Rhodovulum visakhapatnamense]|uniref:HK97 family phage major capsid protein n=1 Tax=Rhodovulum visakhapatnamense TaxID=364297 RepID=A0A4R8FDN4_9RHOB|nr:phage major capsid protein [Rhodovulum visakhapatnamense]TDX20847.1 HK97 family phage major capsid protein [Rhodovulum visakhapatnamense]